jgi:signal transduction histidine kinase
MRTSFFRSLRARLALGAVLWIVVGVSVAGFFIAALFRQQAAENFDVELRGHLEELSSLIDVDAAGAPQLYRRLSDPRFSQPGSGLAWQVSRNGEVLIRSTSISTETLPIPADAPARNEVRRVDLDSAHGRMIVYERLLNVGGAAPMRVEVGAYEEILDARVRSFNIALAVSLALLALALVVAAMLQVGFGLQPMSRLRAALAAIKSGEAAQLPHDFPSEVQPLVDDLSGMMELNRDMLQRARAQAGNLAHGLKTPLAIMTDEAYRLAAKGQTEAASVISQQCQRMQRQIDYQIARARAAASRAMPGVAAPVAPAVDSIVAAMRRLHAAKALQFDIREDVPCIVQCDPMDLNEMLANLIDNACKWAVQEIRIRSGIDARSDMVTITIADDGPGLPPEAMDVVFRIGERLDERVPGSGLGLPIVRDLAQLYGGAVRLERARSGGLKAVLTLPQAK